QKAEELYSADKFGDAEPLFQAALRAEDRFIKRQAFNRLMNLYVRSGRPDKAIKLSTPYRDWLKEVDDRAGLAALDLLTGECLLERGSADKADKHPVAALAASSLPPERKLETLRLRAEVALQRKDTAEKDRWAELEKTAADLAKQAQNDNDGAARIT